MFSRSTLHRFSWIFLFVFTIITGGVRAGKDHKALLDKLLSRYDINERPVHNENDTINVKFGVTILSLIDMNIAQGVLELNLWLSLEWSDINLVWDPAEYGGITKISIPPHRIWKPDILLYNSIHPDFDPTYQTQAVIKSNGTINYIPPGVFRSPCRTDVVDYPFDEHNCSLKFGSWTWDSKKINLTLNSQAGAEISSFVSHSEWKLLGAPGVENRVKYACCPNPYIDITFTVMLRRRGEGVFSGCSFALFLGAVAILLSLSLPTNSSQRLSLGVVTLVGLLIMGNGINSTLGGRPSTIVNYLQTLSFLTFLSVVFNVSILYFYKRNPIANAMPNLLRIVFCETIPPFILLSRPRKDQSCRIGSVTAGQSGNVVRAHDNYEELVSDLQVLVQKMSGQDSEPLNDWQYFAIVLDRLTFLFYCLLSAIFFIAFFAAFA